MKWIVAALVGSIILLSVYRILKANFWCRGMETSGFMTYYLTKHPELHIENYECACGGKKLRGLILDDGTKPKGLIVMTHGYGRTIEHYLPEGRYFACHGYKVLMFDGTGFGLSDGQWMRGLPQHVLDMRAVLEDIGEDIVLSGLPLFLYGHSWGGFAADAVLNLGHFPVKGVVSVAAYNEALAVVRKVSKRRYRKMAPWVVMLFELYQILFFGKNAFLTSAQGLVKQGCPALICHSKNDTIVPFNENFMEIYHCLENRRNVQFLPLRGRNHNITTFSRIDVEQRACIRQLKKTYSAETERKLWRYQEMIDETLMQQFVDFYNGCER